MIAIVQYNAGNVRSVQNALNRLGYASLVTEDPEVLLSADKIIFPGVGEASSAMQYLKERGLDAVLRKLEQPVLGICLGLQLLCAYSEEGDTECLGIFPNSVRRFTGNAIIPHMGWNNFKSLEGELFKGVKTSDDVYFVHGYFAELGAETLATCNYIQDFSAALRKNNFYATQFHPEKSAGVGARILKNFLEL
jgi:glutamine amidotransferase